MPCLATAQNREASDSLGARYYSPQLGRFLTPDWSESPQPVPYANLSNPQSLNLYSYVLNNPVTATDPDGHWCLFGWGTTCTKAAPKKLPVKEGGVAAAGALDAAADASAAAADSSFAAAIANSARAAGNLLESSPIGLLLGAALSQTGGDPILMAKEREAEGTGAQDKLLTPGEIKKLKGLALTTIPNS